MEGIGWNDISLKLGYAVGLLIVWVRDQGR